MENLGYALNATVPVFMMIVLGYVFKRIGLIDDAFAAGMNRFVFRAALPVLLFSQMASMDLREVWDTPFVLFCAVSTLLSILLAALLARFVIRDRSIRGEMIQASFRSNAAMLGAALISNLYGTTAMTPLMLIGAVPIYNVFGVMILVLYAPGEDRGFTADTVRRMVRGVVVNPIILGILAGILWSTLRVPYPAVLQKTVSNLGGLAAPLGLMSMGCAFDFKKTSGMLGPVLTASFMKLVGLCAVFLPAAVLLGFRAERLVAILVMLGASSAVNCYVMARNMGHAGDLSAAAVGITTFLTSFTLTGWIWLLRTLGYI